MRTRLFGLLLAAAPVLAIVPAGCTAPPPAWTLDLSGLNVSIGGDPDMWAINTAQWAFADPARTRGLPVEGARAAAALEYMAVQINTAPRWAEIDPISKEELLRARVELRAALGIRPDAPSQQVVSSLLHAAQALAAGDGAAATAALNNPLFTAGPQQTLAVLGALPYLREANIATMHVGANFIGGGGVVRWKL